MSGPVNPAPDRATPAPAGGLPGQLDAPLLPSPAQELRLAVGAGQLAGAAVLLQAQGARFITLLLAQTPAPALQAVFALGGELVVLRASADGEPLRYPAISAVIPAARWAERELAERTGVQPQGLAPGVALTTPEADLLDSTLDGPDVFTLPFGPVRSGVFEAIQFMIETGGEDVPRIRTRPFFKHRGLEQRFSGMTPEAGVHVAERIAGIAGVAHACAFCQAVERALGVGVPPAAERWRVLHAELERIACHLDVIAKQAQTTALSVGHARFQILKESIMRLRVQLSGSRFGRGVLVPGGVRAAGALPLARLRAALDSFEQELRHDERLFRGTASMSDRLIGAGRLSRELLEQLGAVGPLARGSGLSVDARHERPHGEYSRLGLRVITAHGGDAMARVDVRLREIGESLRILRQVTDRLADDGTELLAPLPSGASGDAFGWVEAPQGEVVTWVQVRDGKLARVHVASPSLRNWAIFDHAFPRDVLTDFAFIEHSFGLTAAGADR